MNLRLPRIPIPSLFGPGVLTLVLAATSACVANGGGDQTPICTPGRRTCDGTMVLRCDEHGTRFIQEKACALRCANGACVNAGCVPGATACDGNVIKTCANDGSDYVPTAICVHGCDPGTASCFGDLCPPGARQCENGSSLKVCNVTGSGWTITRCDQGQAGHCVTGGAEDDNLASYCERYSCTPGALRCDGLELVRCNNDGAGETAVALCAQGCGSPGLGSDHKPLPPVCTSPICEPGAVRCTSDGHTLERCNSLGTAWASQSCLVDGLGACQTSYGDDGSTLAQCVPPICSPREKVCRGSDWMMCDDDGLNMNLLQSCSFGCNPITGCLPAVCSAGAQRCSGNFRQICAPDRRSYLTDEYCLAGCTATSGSSVVRCAPLVCGPQDARCSEDGLSVESCKSDGSGWKVSACDPGLVCRSGLCVLPSASCPSGATRCVASTVQVCGVSNDGPAAYATVGQCLGSCASTGSACDAYGGCTAFSLAVAAGQQPLAPGAVVTIESGLMVGPDGVPVPDGTLANVWVDGAALATGDSGTTAPGLQVAVQNGRIRFYVQGPGEVGTATVGARVAQRPACTAKLVLNFSGVGSP